MNENSERDPRLNAIPDTHGHAKGEHKPYLEERPLPLTARMLFLWFYHACRRGYPRFLMVSDHINYLTFEDPAAVNLVRRALKLAQAGDLYGAAESANVEVQHAAAVSEGLRRGMRFSIGAEVDNDPRARPDAQNIVDAMRPDAIVRAVHFVPVTHPVHGENWPWPFDNPEFRELHEAVGTEHLWESYIALVLDAIERLPGHILAHFYVPAAFGWWPEPDKLESYEDRVLDALAPKGMAIEFNTRFLYRENEPEALQRYLEANKRLLRKAKERGVPIAIGADAHSPKDQGGAFEIVLQVLDELEINEIVFPMAGSLRRVALRVAREPEPPRVPEPVKAALPAGGGEDEHEEEPAREVAPPVRKARPAAKPTRAPDTSPERPALHGERHAAAERDGEPAAGRHEETKSARPTEAPPVNDDRSETEQRESEREETPKRIEPSPAVREAVDTVVDASQRAVEAAVDAVSDPKRALKPVAAKVKAAAKAVRSAAAKAVGKASGAKKSAGAKKAAPAKAGAKKSASAAGGTRKSSARKSSAKKAAPARKTTAKKAAPSRAPAKKTAAKKTGAKKSGAKKSAARSSGRGGAAKKTAAKKSGNRRR